MVTYQEYEAALDKEKFIIETMDDHLASISEMLENEQYYYGENPFLNSFKNNLTLRGEDGSTTNIDLSPTIKIPSGFFGIIVGHIVGRLWDNPVQIGRAEEDGEIAVDEVLGDNFTSDVHQMAINAAIHGVCYAFYNHERVEMFKATEYKPFCDERNGAHRAGLRFWRVADKKPWVVQLYGMTGYTEWLRQDDETKLVHVGDFPYTRQIPVGGEGYVATTPITAGEPYPEYPIVPLYTNPARMSEMTAPIRAKINAYDAKETGYMDEALKMKFVMWIFKGFGGDPDKLKGTLRMLQELGIIAGGDVEDTSIDMKPTDIPFQSHESTQARLEADIYRDARIMNPKVLTSGGVTTVAIRAAMQREDKKMVGVESEARKFIARLLDIAGVEYEHITFTHRTLVNELEIVQMLVQGLPDLPFEWRAKLSPAIPQEVTDEIIASYEAEQIGMSEADIAAFERLNNGQGDEQQNAPAGQAT